MRKRTVLLSLLVTIFLAGCASVGLSIAQSTDVPPIPTNQPLDTDDQLTQQGLLPTPLPTITASPEPLPAPSERYNFLILGGDYREHREGTGWGDKTDVMLLVSVTLDPNTVTVHQFNRNFYHPVEGLDDQWLFAVYGNEGFPGLHYYFQEVFDVPLTGIAYVNMDNFVALVDRLGGLEIGGEVRDGEQVLAYLRDNDNNWGKGVYDADNRQFWTLYRLVATFNTQYVMSNPIDLAELVWFGLTELVQTDISSLDQFHYLATVAVELRQNPPNIEGPIKMDQSDVFEYGDTPLPVRGWIAAEGRDPGEWINEAWSDLP